MASSGGILSVVALWSIWTLASANIAQELCKSKATWLRSEPTPTIQLDSTQYQQSNLLGQQKADIATVGISVTLNCKEDIRDWPYAFIETCTATLPTGDPKVKVTAGVNMLPPSTGKDTLPFPLVKKGSNPKTMLECKLECALHEYPTLKCTEKKQAVSANEKQIESLRY